MPASTTSSSIFWVAIGSSADAGSSIRMTSGSTAKARAMQSRCCWPPDKPKAELFSRSLTSSHKAASRRAFSTRSFKLALLLWIRFIRIPYATFSKIDFGNGFGFWNTMPMRRRTSVGFTFGSYRLTPWYSMSPSTRAPAMRSFMRLKQRSTVVLPQPDGPMNAEISLRRISMSTLRTARCSP